MAGSETGCFKGLTWSRKIKGVILSGTNQCLIVKQLICFEKQAIFHRLLCICADVLIIMDAKVWTLLVIISVTVNSRVAGGPNPES